MKRTHSADRFRLERSLWRRGLRRIAGLDEAGRGPLAGPVVAAAVQLPAVWMESGLPAELRGLNDSKQVGEGQREGFYGVLTGAVGVRYAIATVSAAVVDRINILAATHRAMNDALARLHPPPDHVLVDGWPVPSLRFPQTAQVKGDTLSYSIAAASILAKVTRDRVMREYDALYPHYGFARHKGYPTPQHLEALRRYGPCPIHRRTFAPLAGAPPELFPGFASP